MGLLKSGAMLLKTGTLGTIESSSLPHGMRFSAEEYFAKYAHAGAEKSDPVVRAAMYSVFKGRCFYSGRAIAPEESSIDHVIPEALGGPDNIYNFVLASRRLNSVKGDSFDPAAAQAALTLVATSFAPRVERRIAELRVQARPEHVERLTFGLSDNVEFDFSAVVPSINRRASALFVGQAEVHGNMLGDPIALVAELRDPARLGGAVRQAMDANSFTSKKLEALGQRCLTKSLRAGIVRYVSDLLAERKMSEAELSLHDRERRGAYEASAFWEFPHLGRGGGVLEVTVKNVTAHALTARKGTIYHETEPRDELWRAVLSTDKVVS